MEASLFGDLVGVCFLFVVDVIIDPHLSSNFDSLLSNCCCLDSLRSILAEALFVEDDDDDEDDPAFFVSFLAPELRSPTHRLRPDSFVVGDVGVDAAVNDDDEDDECNERIPTARPNALANSGL